MVKRLPASDPEGAVLRQARRSPESVEPTAAGRGKPAGFQLAFPVPHAFESHGARQFVKLFPLMDRSLATGGIAVIDDLDAAIHPVLLQEIISWYCDPLRNPHDAQLWMSCHNASLMETLSKDEIVLCEKDHGGATRLYTLNNVKGVRRDANHYRKYLGGAYGAVPRTG